MTTRQRGFSAEEVALLMGGPMPTDPAQRRAYAVLAMRRLEAHDKDRFAEALYLGSAPDDLLAEWDAIAHENTLRVHGAATNAQHKPIRPEAPSGS